MKLIFTGDLFLGGDLSRTPHQSPVKVDSFSSADIRVVNLEQAVSDRAFVADKGTLHTPTSALSTLEQMGVDVAGLANNHVHDKGAEGIVDTVEQVELRGIRTVGAGRDLAAARTPVRLAPDLVMLAYCDFGRPHLRQVATASETDAGTAPLRRSVIQRDLDALAPGDRAILYLHWGQEHLRLPPFADVELARDLLRSPRVAGIIGMHAHRIQGMLRHGDKRAYMCVGNFLFPNFYLGPPAQLIGKPDGPDKFPQTRRYHSVSRPTYKKWLRVNRTSLVVLFDTERSVFDHQVIIQDDNDPIVREASKWTALVALLAFRILSRLYMLPSFFYRPIQKLDAHARSKFWRLRTLIFRARQVGTKGTWAIIRGNVLPFTKEEHK